MKQKRVFFETEEVVSKKKKGYIDVDMDYFQFYHKAFRHIASLSNVCSKDFILWVMTKVDERNGFTFNEKLFKEFNDDLSKISTPTSYAKTTLMAALRELIKKDMVIKDGRSLYRVNATMFWAGDDIERKKVLEIENSNGVQEPSISIEDEEKQVANMPLVDSTVSPGHESVEDGPEIGGAVREAEILTEHQLASEQDEDIFGTDDNLFKI